LVSIFSRNVRNVCPLSHLPTLTKLRTLPTLRESGNQELLKLTTRRSSCGNVNGDVVFGVAERTVACQTRRLASSLAVRTCQLSRAVALRTHLSFAEQTSRNYQPLTYPSIIVYVNRYNGTFLLHDYSPRTLFFTARRELSRMRCNGGSRGMRPGRACHSCLG